MTDQERIEAIRQRARGNFFLGYIAEQTWDLVAPAPARKLRPDERANATFTLSNLGASGVQSFTRGGRGARRAVSGGFAASARTPGGAVRRDVAKPDGSASADRAGKGVGA